MATKIALITGANKGIGFETARQLGAQGMTVLAAARDEERGRAAERALRDGGADAQFVQLDVTDAKSVQRAAEWIEAEYGRLDVLVNNAGIDIIKPVEEVTGEEYQKIIDINLSGYFHCSQFAGRHMLEHGGGSIINNSSIASTAGIHGLVAYSAAKGGVNMLTRVMAAEWATRGVRVNAIAPGYFDNIMRDAGTEHARPEKQEQVKRFTPMERRGRPNELVGPVLFLASDASSYVTGNILFVDGGYTAI